MEISDLALGGHVVVQDPPSAAYTADYANLLVDDDIRQTVESVGGAPVSWTVGFHHDRAAQIDRSSGSIRRERIRQPSSPTSGWK